MPREPNLFRPFLDQPVTQTDLAMLLGTERSVITTMISQGRLPKGTLREQVRAYVFHCRENGFNGNLKRKRASGRLKEDDDTPGDDDEIDPNKEKALLQREQRRGHEIKNRIAEGKYAEIGLLTDVLAAAAGAVRAEFEQLEGRLAKECPQLDAQAVEVVLKTIAKARNRWVEKTKALVLEQIEAMAEDEGDDE